MSEVNYKALLIGNSDYRGDDRLPPLKGPGNDVEALGRALTDGRWGLHAQENVSAHTNLKRHEMSDRIGDFFANVGKDDQVLFYFSGHGWPGGAGLFLCAVDTNVDRLAQTAISNSFLNEVMDQITCSRLVIILDCCYSGAFKGSVLPDSLSGNGRFVITSSRAAEISLDGRLSAFTENLVKAVTSDVVDANDDGFIGVSEVYDFVDKSLREQGRQRPLKKEAAVGDLPIARDRMKPPPGRPILKVSPALVQELHLDPGDIVERVVDVTNEGGGILRWKAETNSGWITLEPHPERNCLKLRLTAGLVTSRGQVIVRDEGLGGSDIIRVVVKVKKRRTPVLELDDRPVDFGTVYSGSQASVQARAWKNATGPIQDLTVNVTVPTGWVSVSVESGVARFALDSSKVGNYRGVLLFESNGGNLQVPVTAVVLPRPTLSLSDKKVEFGHQAQGQGATIWLAVANPTDGILDWDFSQTGTFFRAVRQGDRIQVTLDAPPGEHVGAIRVTSNGGEAEIPVHAFVGPVSQPVAPAAAPVSSLTGRWSIRVSDAVGSVMLVDLHDNFSFQGTQTTTKGSRSPVSAVGQWCFDAATYLLQLWGTVDGHKAFHLRIGLRSGTHGTLEGVDDKGVVYWFSRL